VATVKRRRSPRLFRTSVACACIALVVVGSAAQAAPGPVFTVNSQSGLYARSGPGEEFPPVALLPYLSQIQMECQLRVPMAAGGSQIWDKLLSDDPTLDGNWVLDTFLVPSGSNEFNNLVPLCDKPPTGSITHPRAGREVKPGTRMTISGRFEDDLGIDRVEYFVSTGSPSSWMSLGLAEKQGEGVFTKPWVVDYPLGTTLTLAATITDTGGNVVSLTGTVAGIRVSDRDHEPEGVMTSPAPAALAAYGAPITLSATVTDDEPLEEVKFSVRVGLGDWSEAGSDTTADGDSYSVQWTATFPTYQPGALVGFKATVVDSVGHQVDILGPNNVIVTQLRTEREVSLKIVQFKDGSFGAMGRLSVPKNVLGCRKGMVVRIERWQEDHWVRAGSAVTKANGAYSTIVKKKDYAATFRSVVDEFPKADGNVCLEAVSNKTHFGAGTKG
jgi:hypothetical protein